MSHCTCSYVSYFSKRDFRSYAQDLKVIYGSGRPTKIQNNYQTSQYLASNAWMQVSNISIKKKLQIGRKKMPNCKQHTATQIYEVSIDGKDYLKVIADARLKVAKGLGPAMPFMMR